MKPENFLDPLLTSDGKPYGPERFKQLVKEKYIISKNTNTSFVDVGKIIPAERDLIISFIIEDLEMNKRAIENAQQRKK